MLPVTACSRLATSTAVAVVVLGVIGDTSVAVPAETPAPPHATAPPPAWTVQVDPLTTVLGYVHVQVERVLAPQLSIYVAPSLRLYSSLLSDGGDQFIGLGAELGVRWFVRRHAPRGTWLQARGVLARLSSDTATSAGGYVSVLVGHTWIIGRRWVLAAGVGIQYVHYTVAGMGATGLLPAAHTTVGVAF